MKLDRRRSSLEIIADMLRLGEAGLKDYIRTIGLDRGLIDKVKLGNPSVTYRVTRKGLEVLRSIDGLMETLELRDNDNSELE